MPIRGVALKKFPCLIDMENSVVVEGGGGQRRGKRALGDK